MTAVVRAGLLCARRRLGWPAVLVAATLPVLAFVLGDRAGPAFASAVESSRPLALSFGLGLGGAAAVGGIVIALVAPRRRFLGSQLAAAPLSPAAVFLVVTCAPVLLAGLAGSAVEAAFLVPAVGDAAPVALAAGWAGFALGAAAAEGALALRASPAGAFVLAGVAGLWALGAIGTGAGGVAGPFGYLGLALRDEAPAAGHPALALLGTAAAGLLLWGVAAAVRPDDLPRRGDVRAVLPVGRRPAAAVFVVALKRYGRRAELRRIGGAVAAFAGLGGLLLVVFSGELAISLIAIVAVVGAAVIPLAATGIEREAEWLWRAAPSSRGSIAAAGTAAGIAAGTIVVAVGVAPGAAWARADARSLLEILAVTAFVLSAAAIAGVLVPWRADRPADELLSFGTFVVVAAGLWYVLGHAAEALGGGTPATAALLAAEAAGAVMVAALLAGRGERC